MDKKKLLLTSLFFAFYGVGATTANAKQESINQLNTDVGYEDGVFTPRGTLPINWTSNLSSSISYTGKQTISIGSLTDFEDSLNASTIKENRIGLNLLTSEFNLGNNPNSTFSLGISYENVRIKAEEDGFIAVGSDTYRTALKRDITVDRANIPLAYQLRTSNFVNRLNADLTVYSSLSLDQDLYLPFINPDRQTLSNSQTQPLAYQVSWEGVYTRYANWLAPGWRFSYESTPYEYKTLMANANGNIDTNKLKNTTDTLTLEGRFYIGLTSPKKSAYFIGVRRELITVTEKVGGDKGEAKDYLTSLVFGIDGRFN